MLFLEARCFSVRIRYGRKGDMTVQEIVAACSTLNIMEQRALTDEYGELVFYRKDLPEWEKLLIRFFGVAAKPAGERPTEEALGLTGDCGGMQDNQTLFKKEANGFTVIAMLWPWQDGAHVTLKIILRKPLLSRQKPAV